MEIELGNSIQLRPGEADWYVRLSVSGRPFIDVYGSTPDEALNRAVQWVEMISGVDKTERFFQGDDSFYLTPMERAWGR